MPVTRIQVGFDGVYVNDSSDIWGAGEWYITAKVDGKPLGNPNKEFEAREKEWIVLPKSEWSVELDLTNKKSTDEIVITMKIRDEDVFVDDDLGEVKLKLKYPFRTEYSAQPLKSPGGEYTASVTVKILEIKATTTPDKSGGVLVSRQNNGSSTFSTLSNKPVTPRVEVCPVIPVPTSPSKLPKRPNFLAELKPGAETEWAKPIVLTAAHAPNVLANPSLIPVLSKTDPDLDKKAAQLAVTWRWPGDLDLSMLTWHVKEGPVEIIGSNSGPNIKVRGTSAPTDTMATLEVRWDGEKGPLLSTYRAWVGVIKEVPYRINIIGCVDPVKFPERNPILLPDDVHAHMQIAKIIMWQAGLEFVPDKDTTCWDGAVASSHPGVFTVQAKDDKWTVKVNVFGSPVATRLNCNPGVLHVAYVTSAKQNRAAASDIQGVDGKDEKLGGAPSSSWLLPSGVPPDADAAQITMKTFPPQTRSNSTDAAYVKARQKVQASFKADDLKKRLYACIYPADWASGLGDTTHAIWAINLAHELGHVLGLRHRGSGDSNNPPLSDDGVNCEDDKGKKRGHPWNENVMTYGYGVLGWGADGKAQVNVRAVDIDLLQTPVVRRHPAAKPKA